MKMLITTNSTCKQLTMYCFFTFPCCITLFQNEGVWYQGESVVWIRRPLLATTDPINVAVRRKGYLLCCYRWSGPSELLKALDVWPNIEQLIHLTFLWSDSIYNSYQWVTSHYIVISSIICLSGCALSELLQWDDVELTAQWSGCSSAALPLKCQHSDLDKYRSVSGICNNR